MKVMWLIMGDSGLVLYHQLSFMGCGKAPQSQHLFNNKIRFSIVLVIVKAENLLFLYFCEKMCNMHYKVIWQIHLTMLSFIYQNTISCCCLQMGKRKEKKAANTISAGKVGVGDVIIRSMQDLTFHDTPISNQCTCTSDILHFHLITQRKCNFDSHMQKTIFSTSLEPK